MTKNEILHSRTYPQRVGYIQMNTKKNYNFVSYQNINFIISLYYCCLDDDDNILVESATYKEYYYYYYYFNLIIIFQLLEYTNKKEKQ